MKATKTFFQKVDRRSRKKMTEFLLNHFRYNTMNSWNGARSWANNLKVHNVIPLSLQDKVYEIMETEEFGWEIRDLIHTYDIMNSHLLQAGFNGQSGGYLVMYEGYCETKTIFTFDDEKRMVNYAGRDYADGYGWKSKEEAIAQGLYKKQIKKIGTMPGRSIDYFDEDDYATMDISDLTQIVVRVQCFDTLCDKIVQATIDMALNNEVVDEEYIVTKTRKVLV